MLKKQFYFLFSMLLCMLVFSGCTSVPSNVSGAATEQTNTVDDLEATLEEAVLTLTGEVSDTLSRVDNLGIPEGTLEEQRTQFLDLKEEISEVDRRIDDLDDTIEKNYRNSQISLETYKKLDRELDSLENLMDAAEDKLEFTFGMED